MPVPDKKPPLWKALREARTSAEELRAQFDLDTAPIDVERILRGVGVEMAEGSGGSEAGSIRINERNAAMWISLDEPEDRRRYTVACLLGYLMLHPPGEYSLAPSLYGEQEDPIATAYAKELLLPRALVEAAQASGKLHLHQLFGVPKDVFARRARELEAEAKGNDARSSSKMTPISNVMIPPASPPPIPVSQDERRQHLRVPARIQLRFEQTGQAARALRAYSLDLSVGGLCIKTSRRYEIGETLKLTLKVENEDFTLEGAVAWARSGAIGVRFERVSPDDKKRLGAIVASLQTQK